MSDLEKLRGELAYANYKKEVSQHQLTLLENKLSKEERKARTRKLIQEGAELESLFPGLKELPVEDFITFTRELVKIPQVMELYEKLKASASAEQEGGDD